MSNIAHYVSFEGGPILVGSAKLLSSWRGIESTDYEELCSLFDHVPSSHCIPLTRFGNSAIAVDFGGAGTIRVLPIPDGIALVRAWHDDPDSDDIYAEALQVAPSNIEDSGDIELNSTAIVIAWAAESLEGLPSTVSGPTRPSINLSVDDSVVLFPLSGGRYSWTRDELNLSGGQVVRFILRSS